MLRVVENELNKVTYLTYVSLNAPYSLKTTVHFGLEYLGRKENNFHHNI